jgi:hypothetical protein
MLEAMSSEEGIGNGKVRTYLGRTRAVDDLPNKVKIPRRRRSSSPRRHVKENVRGHVEPRKETGTEGALTWEGRGLSMAKAKAMRDVEESRGELRR